MVFQRGTLGHSDPNYQSEISALEKFFARYRDFTLRVFTFKYKYQITFKISLVTNLLNAGILLIAKTRNRPFYFVKKNEFFLAKALGIDSFPIRAAGLDPFYVKTPHWLSGWESKISLCRRPVRARET